MTGFASRTVCGSNGSQLHLIAEGEHALDLCLAPGLCLSGSAESADEVASSLRTMLDWSSADTVRNEDGGSDGLFAGRVFLPSLCMLFLVWLTRWFTHRRRCEYRFDKDWLK